MHVHRELRDRLLPLADGFDRLQASAARARLHAIAALARAAHGQPPTDFLHGPATPFEVISEGPLARLLLYRRDDATLVRKTPILVVASLINRYYVLDLLPELSVIGKLAANGFDVWVLDWKAPGELGPQLRFTDYVDGAIAWGAREAARASGNEAPLVLGYCMGGTLSVMFAARHPELVKGLVLLGTPVDFHRSGQLATFTRREVFDAELLMDAFGNMPPLLMQSGFKVMNPADAVFKIINLILDGRDEQRVRHVVALESWLTDNIAFPGGVYREYIGALYQDNALIAGRFRLGGDAVELHKLIAPLLNVIALRDHICAPASSRALMDVVGATDMQTLEFDTGHIGMTTSRRAHDKLWPAIIAWMEQHAA